MAEKEREGKVLTDNNEGGSSEGRRDVMATQEFACEDEIDLFDLIQTLWRQKWVVVACILASFMAVLVYLATVVPRYQISMQVRPGITGYNAKGEAQRRWSVEDIVTWVREGQYRLFVPKKLVPEKKLRELRFTAKKTRQANNVTLIIYHPDPVKGVQILQAIYDNFYNYYVNQGNDAQIALNRKMFAKEMQDLEDSLTMVDRVQRVSLDLKIKSKKEDIDVIRRKIDLVRQKVSFNETILAKIEQNMQKTMANTAKLVTLRDQLIAKGKVEDISLLLYTNIIQQNIFYVSQLQEQISALKETIIKDRQEEVLLAKQIEDLKNDIDKIRLSIREELAAKKREIQRNIKSIKEKMNALAPIEEVTRPIASTGPVKPRKRFTLMLAVVIGGFMGIVLAFFRSGWLARYRKNGSLST